VFLDAFRDGDGKSVGRPARKPVINRSYVAKDERSVYEGGATRRWLKVKQKDWTVEDDGGSAPSSGRADDDADCSQSFAGCRAAAPRVGRHGVRRVRVGHVDSFFRFAGRVERAS
jgi:hypothetical protein